MTGLQLITEPTSLGATECPLSPPPSTPSTPTRVDRPSTPTPPREIDAVRPCGVRWFAAMISRLGVDRKVASKTISDITQSEGTKTIITSGEHHVPCSCFCLFVRVWALSYVFCKPYPPSLVKRNVFMNADVNTCTLLSLGCSHTTKIQDTKKERKKESKR